MHDWLINVWLRDGVIDVPWYAGTLVRWYPGALPPADGTLVRIPFFVEVHACSCVVMQPWCTSQWHQLAVLAHGSFYVTRDAWPRK